MYKISNVNNQWKADDADQQFRH